MCMHIERGSAARTRERLNSGLPLAGHDIAARAPRATFWPETVQTYARLQGVYSAKECAQLLTCRDQDMTLLRAHLELGNHWVESHVPHARLQLYKKIMTVTTIDSED